MCDDLNYPIKEVLKANRWPRIPVSETLLECTARKEIHIASWSAIQADAPRRKTVLYQLDWQLLIWTNRTITHYGGFDDYSSSNDTNRLVNFGVPCHLFNFFSPKAFIIQRFRISLWFRHEASPPFPSSHLWQQINGANPQFITKSADQTFVYMCASWRILIRLGFISCQRCKILLTVEPLPKHT